MFAVDMAEDDLAAVGAPVRRAQRFAARVRMRRSFAAVDVDQIETVLAAVLAPEGHRPAVRAERRVRACGEDALAAGRQIVHIDLAAAALLEDQLAGQARGRGRPLQPVCAAAGLAAGGRDRQSRWASPFSSR